MPANLPVAGATVILVHGAFANGSCWNRVVERLQRKGIDVVAVHNPLTSLADDVASTRRAIDAAPGPVVLVGHSWGGAVITQSGDDPKVKALVYVAAFAPDAGMSVLDLGKDKPPSPGVQTFVVSPAGFITIPKNAYVAHFSQDLPEAEAAVHAATQGPAAARAFDDKLTVAAWRSKPSWYVVSGQDHMIDPNGERAMARAMNAKTTELDAGHVSMLSQPDRVTAVIEEALSAVAAMRSADAAE